MKLDGRRDLRSCLSPPPYQMLPHDCCSETCPLLTITSLLLCSCAPTNGPSSTWSQSASEHPSHHTTSAHTHAHTHTPLSHVLAWLGEPLSSVLLSPSSNPIKATHILLVPPCSSAHGISQGRIPEQGAISYPTEHPPSQGSLPCPHTLPILFPLGRVRFPWALVSPLVVTV